MLRYSRLSFQLIDLGESLTGAKIIFCANIWEYLILNIFFIPAKQEFVYQQDNGYWSIVCGPKGPGTTRQAHPDCPWEALVVSVSKILNVFVFLNK